MIDSNSIWSATSIPASVTIRSAASKAAPNLLASLSAAVASAVTELDGIKQVSLSQVVRGAQASLTLIHAENVLATATNAAVEQDMRGAIYDASLNLQFLYNELNWYRTDLCGGANIFYLVVFAVTAAYTFGMWFRSLYQWYNVSFFLFQALQTIGWFARTMSALHDETNVKYYLVQIINLSVSVAFLMGGVYFLFGQMIVIYGREYSMFKPLWYSYLFITCDILAILTQAVGGALAALATLGRRDASIGTDLMTAGITLQTVAIALFLVCWFEFLYRIYFRRWKEAVEWKPAACAKPSVINYLKFLFNTKLTREYRETTLDLFYNPQFSSIRARPLFKYFPLVMTITGLLLFTRCVYRIAELKQGLGGYLITHEAYLLSVAAPMVAVTTILFVPFHPVWVFGPQNKVKMALIINRADEASHKQRWGKESIWLS